MDKAEPYKKYGHGARATQIPDSLFSLYAIKIVGDGSNQTKTAAQTLPYLNSERKGPPELRCRRAEAMVAAVKANGWPISIHCNGDATLDIALDAIEAAYGANPPTGINRIEHCTITRPEQIVRMTKLGVQPSFLMNHVYFYGAAYRDQLFGPERAARMDPAADCINAGSPFTLHTDAPCSNIGTLQNIQTAVTRRCNVDDSVVGADQAIPLTEAMKAVTVHAAGQIGMEDRIGSLEAGKEADLTILESDPYKVDPDTIMDIKVSEDLGAGTKNARLTPRRPRTINGVSAIAGAPPTEQPAARRDLAARRRGCARRVGDRLDRDRHVKSVGVDERGRGRARWRRGLSRTRDRRAADRALAGTATAHRAPPPACRCRAGMKCRRRSARPAPAPNNRARARSCRPTDRATPRNRSATATKWDSSASSGARCVAGT